MAAGHPVENFNISTQPPWQEVSRVKEKEEGVHAARIRTLAAKTQSIVSGPGQARRRAPSREQRRQRRSRPVRPQQAEQTLRRTASVVAGGVHPMRLEVSSSRPRLFSCSSCRPCPAFPAHPVDASPAARSLVCCCWSCWGKRSSALCSSRQSPRPTPRSSRASLPVVPFQRRRSPRCGPLRPPTTARFRLSPSA